jgi:hypothetical protein
MLVTGFYAMTNSRFFCMGAFSLSLLLSGAFQRVDGKTLTGGRAGCLMTSADVDLEPMVALPQSLVASL